MLKTIKGKMVLSIFLLILLIQGTSTVQQIFQIQSILTDGITSEAQNVTTPIFLKLTDEIANSASLGQFDEEGSLAKFVKTRFTIVGFKQFASLMNNQPKLNNLQYSTPEGEMVKHSASEATTAEGAILELLENKQLQSKVTRNEIIVLVPYFYEDQFYGGLVFSYSKAPLDAEIQQSLITSVALLLLYLAIGVGGAWLISGTIVRPVHSVSLALEDIVAGEGDLTHEIQISSKDEISILAKHFNHFMLNIRTIIRSINQHAQEFSKTADELEAMAEENKITLDQVTAAIGKEASEINEAASTIQEMARNVQNTKKEIEEIETIASSAEVQAKKGSQAVIAANHSMKKLDESSRKIEGIIQVITEISNQTNLLSLNAAIEAAKAGDSGKGFAVVADEVRILAERSANSVVEIRQLIEQSSANVVEVNEVNQQTGEILETIIELVSKISQQINMTSQVFKEQDVGIHEIASTADMLSESSSNNAEAINQLSHNTEQLNNHTESVAHLSEKLTEQVERFKIEK